jgi:capsular exopolysaccharide synthesis family protein
MSRIFDALLRAQAERSGAGPIPTKSAKDLLQHAERNSSSGRRSSSGMVDRARGAQGAMAGRRDTGDILSEVSAAARELLGDLENPASREDILEQFQDRSPVLPDDTRLVCIADQQSPAAEAFRLLGVRIRRMGSQNLGNKLLITSTTPAEGKSTIAANLACTLANGSQQSVLLVDGDLRRPVLAEMFGLRQEPGLSEYLRGSNEIANSIYKLQDAGFWLMPAGDSLGNVLELLQSSKLSSMMEALADLFDWVIIDSPPMLPLADTSIWERWADGILMVARQGVTRKKALQRGLEAFSAQNKLVGAVVNSFDGLPLGDYYYYRPSNKELDR